jgi:hypothetical protein
MDLLEKSSFGDGARHWRVTRFAACFAAAGAVLLPMTIEAQDAHFGGFRCTRECISHAAGYRWAECEGIARIDDCRGLSIPFIEGCRVYVADPWRGAGRDDAGRPIIERPRWPQRLPER